MRNRIKSATWGLVLAFCLAAPVRADTIFFKNRMRLDIEKAWVENGQVMCEMYGSVVSYPVEVVERIEKGLHKKGLEDEIHEEPTSGEAAEQPERQHQNSTQESGLTYHQRAMQMAERSAWKEAFELETKACRLEPDQGKYREALARYCLRYAELQLNKGRQAAALDILKAGLNTAPGHPDLHKAINRIFNTMGYQYLEKQKFSECRKLIREMKYFDGNNPQIYVLEGDIAYQAGKYKKARNNWMKALTLDSSLVMIKGRLNKLQQDQQAEGGLRETGSGRFTISYEGEENLELAQEVQEVLESAYHDVGRELNLYPRDSIPVLIYPRSNLKELDYFPDWAAGLYDGKIRLGEDLWKKRLFFKATLYHEYSHVLVRMLGGTHVPLWLNEGLSEYAARKFKKPSERGFRKRLIIQALKQKRLFPIGQLSLLGPAFLSQLPPPMITLVYAQSESFTRYLIDEFSMVEIRDLIKRLGKGGGLHECVLRVLSEDLSVLEQRWHAELLKQ